MSFSIRCAFPPSAMPDELQGFSRVMVGVEQSTDTAVDAGRREPVAWGRRCSETRPRLPLLERGARHCPSPRTRGKRVVDHFFRRGRRGALFVFGALVPATMPSAVPAPTVRLFFSISPFAGVFCCPFPVFRSPFVIFCFSVSPGGFAASQGRYVGAGLEEPGVRVMC